MWVAKSAIPDPNRLSPMHWWKQLFSLRGLSRSVLGVPKLTVVFVTTSLILWYRCDALLESTMLPLSAMVDALSQFVFGSCLVVALVLLGMSLLDFVIEYFSFHQRLRMTDQQLRDEQRSQSGDPQIINKRRRLHRQLNGRK
jgi:flagellar biosynthetic protein FlhB